MHYQEVKNKLSGKGRDIVANFLTVFRIILAFFTLWLLFLGKADFYLSAFFLTIIVIALDGLDGYVARKRNECSKLGSVIDILGDRIVENAYWIVFAVLSWVPAWIPILVVSRGLTTDTIRGMALAEGFTAFGDSTMMQNKIGAFLTSSRFSRALYGAAKAFAFFIMIIAHIPAIEEYKPMTVEQYVSFVHFQPTLVLIANILAYITVVMCVIRGIPVLLESKRFFSKYDKQ